MYSENVAARKTAGSACLLVLAALVGSLFLTAAPAGAQETCAINIADYEGSATITTDNLNPQAGEDITFTGNGFPPGTVVPLALNGESIGSPVTSETGGFTFAYTIPTDLPVGSALEFSATCGAFVLSQTITIAGQPAPAPAPAPAAQPLPVTGSDVGGIVKAGLALIVVGGLVLLAVRRRSAEPVAARA